MGEHPSNGHSVPATAKCHFCGRGPRMGEKFGRAYEDWDAPGMICPDCWPKE